MLADFLQGEYWHTVADGVKMYKLPQGRLLGGDYRPERGGQPERYGLFFCCGGQMTLQRREFPDLTVRDKEILLFSDFDSVERLGIMDPLMGYWVAIDPALSRDTFESFYQLLRHSDLGDGRVGGMLRDHGGCIAIHNNCWNQAVFAVLRSLPFSEQGAYCISKIAELFYLLCAHHALLDGMPDQLPTLGYSASAIHHAHDYMEAHLDEKLTIDTLSRQFHLSATALKTGFRALYDQPIHAWLQNRRIQKAAELLQFSDMTVLQIAQSVGYEGVSQFNVVFKRVYGVTPSHYRKMSNTGSF